MREPDPRARDLGKCEDMHVWAEQARRFMGDRTLDEFRRDEVAQILVIHSIQIVGEAARLVSQATRNRAQEIPWLLIVGMRNVLVHDYTAVDLDTVYDTVSLHLPPLLASLERLIKELAKECGEED